MERVPIGFELPPAEKKDDEIVEIVPQKIEGVSMAPEIPKTEQAPAMPPEMPKEEAAAEHVVEPPLQKEAVGEEGAENGEKPQNQSEKPARNLDEVIKLFQDAEAIKEKEPDGEFSGEGRASRLRWENAFDEFARNPDFSSFANNPDTKKRLEDVLEEYKKYQEIEDRSKTDTGHIYTETDIQTINKARAAVRGYLESRAKEKDAVATETDAESQERVQDILGAPLRQFTRGEIAKESPPPPDNLPVMEGAAQERGKPDEAVVDATVSEVSRLVDEKRKEKSREKTPKLAKIIDLAEGRRRRGAHKKESNDIVAKEAKPMPLAVEKLIQHWQENADKNVEPKAEKPGFEIGKRVRVQRSDGTTEENWMVGPKDEKTGRIRVMREEGELVKHVTPEELAEWNGGSKKDKSLEEAIRERGKEIHASSEGARSPYEFLSDRAKALFEKLGDEVKERLQGVCERAKFNTVDRAAVLYNNMFYDYHEKYIRANNAEIAAIDREINERRGIILRSKEMRAEGGAVSGRLRRKSEGAVLKSEAGIQKLIARKEILKSRAESRNARQSLFETRRQNILEKVSEHTSEALRPHDRRMERIRQEMKGVEEIIARFSQERKKIQDKISQLEREQENAPRANRRILRAMAAEQKFALKGRDKLIAEQRGKLNALAKKQAAVDKKAQPWRETSARFKNLVGKK